MKTTLKNMPAILNPFGLNIDGQDFLHLYQTARRLKTRGYEHMVLQLQASHCFNSIVVVPDYDAKKYYPDNITVCALEATDIHSYRNFAKSVTAALVALYNETHEDKISA